MSRPSLLARFSAAGVSVSLGMYTLIAAGMLALLVLIPAVAFETPEVAGREQTRKATVRRVLEERLQAGPRGTETYQRLELDLDGEPILIERSFLPRDALAIKPGPGDRVLVSRVDGPGGPAYFIEDYVREGGLWWLALAFGALVLVIGRRQGLAALFGMAISLAVILRFIIPGIVAGHDPVIISVAGAGAIMASSLYIAHGMNRKTTTALLGTMLGLAITAILARFSIELVALTGLADEESATLNIITEGGINPEGLLLAGIIIGALGVLDDVTIAQASSVYEIRAANPLLPAAELYRRAMNIGRDHIASTVNTLFLAYAGAALPLLIILSLQAEPAGVLLNREFLATEIARTLVGSIGILAAVPLTTALAALAARAGRAAGGGTARATSLAAD
ncbi:MAG TPA: YibE/F family protein [Dehalococcoidia bacterium]|nr:YibE/F family protein [Dehalococcoidia bacterium]